MQESYSEDLASHAGPESCASARKGGNARSLSTLRDLPRQGINGLLEGFECRHLGLHAPGQFRGRELYSLELGQTGGGMEHGLGSRDPIGPEQASQLIDDLLA